jgi:ABC-type transport system involved in multi-copper enzyme maturation permease subunit
MKNVLLIAGNHLRDQRWILLTMFSYVLFMSTIMAAVVHRSNYEDARFFVEQQMWFAVLFGMFLSTSAVNTDMRTRRLPSILSKAVERWHYLLGVLIAISSAIAVYCAVVSVLGMAFSSRAGHPIHGIVHFAGDVLVATVAVETVGLFFGLLVPPIFATTATVGVLTVIPLIALQFAPRLMYLAPIAMLVTETMREFDGSAVPGTRTAMFSTAVYAIIVFFIALAVFQRRDLASATE